MQNYSLDQWQFLLDIHRKDRSIIVIFLENRGVLYLYNPITRIKEYPSTSAKAG